MTTDPVKESIAALLDHLTADLEKLGAEQLAARNGRGWRIAKGAVQNVAALRKRIMDS